MFNVYKSFVWLISVKERQKKKDKTNFPISAMSEAGQRICCNNKNVDCTMLSSHFLVNQIAGKLVRISCHIIMCWYELAVQFVGPALAWLNSPVVGALGSLTRLNLSARCGGRCLN